MDDPLTLYVNAQAAAKRIPSAKLVTIENGVQLLLGHEERIRSEIAAFLEKKLACSQMLSSWLLCFGQ